MVLDKGINRLNRLEKRNRVIEVALYSYVCLKEII